MERIGFRSKNYILKWILKFNLLIWKKKIVYIEEDTDEEDIIHEKYSNNYVVVKIDFSWLDNQLFRESFFETRWNIYLKWLPLR